MRQQLPGFRKNHAPEKVAAQEAFVNAVHAAEKLLPSTVREASDNDVKTHLELVYPYLKSGLPLVACKGLLERRARQLLEKDMSSCISIMWPTGPEPEKAFDAMQPTLRHLGTSWSNKLDEAVQFWCRSALPSLMERAENDTAAAHALGKLGIAMLCQATQPDSVEIMQQKEAKLMLHTCAGISALLQAEPVQEIQVQALQNAKSNNYFGAGSRLGQLLKGAFWDKKLKEFWHMAADELVAGPKITSCIAAFTSEENTETAWRELKLLWPQWCKTLRQICLQGLKQAAQKRLWTDMQKLHAIILSDSSRADLQDKALWTRLNIQIVFKSIALPRSQVQISKKDLSSLTPERP